MPRSSIRHRFLACMAAAILALAGPLGARQAEGPALSEREMRKVLKGLVVTNTTGNDYRIRLKAPEADQAKTPGKVELYTYDPIRKKLSDPTILNDDTDYALPAGQDSLIAPVPQKSWFTARPDFNRLFILKGTGTNGYLFRLQRDGGKGGDDKRPRIQFYRMGRESGPPINTSLADDEGGLTLEIEGPI